VASFGEQADAPAELPKELRPFCAFYESGQCKFGNDCWYQHAPVEYEDIDADSPQEQAAVRLIVNGPPGGWRKAEAHAPDTGPMRVRVVGDIQGLGCFVKDFNWDPYDGVDLVWEDDCWTSMLVPAPPCRLVSFYVCRLDQQESHPGTLQGKARFDMESSRRFTWSRCYKIQTPGVGEVLEVRLGCGDVLPASPGARPAEPEPARCRCTVMPRGDALAFPQGAPLRALPSPGCQRCYTFDAPGGVTVNFSLYLPPSYEPYHSMHGRLDGDNNLFFESDTPVRLLLGDARSGWFEQSTYNSGVEEALASLFEATAAACNIDRRRILVTGTSTPWASMGAYACLELGARWPGFFAAAAPVAPHYDLDPVEALVDNLTQTQELPLWIFHAKNDGMCPYEPIADLVARLGEKSRAEVRFTSYEDTWSSQGHCADRVAYWAGAPPEGQEPWHGPELFEWLAARLGPGRRPGAPAAGRPPAQGGHPA
ncbi:unnamed protein product, partial [Prorocentrum cordatum]